MAKRAKKKSQVQAQVGTGTGVAWYASDQWPRLLELSEDRNLLHETHAQWLVDAEKLVSQLASQGVVARRVPVDVDAMCDWCRAQNLPFNSAGRSKFVTWWLNRKPWE
jgi:hypothetical protein